MNVKINLTFKIGKKQKKVDYTIVSQDLKTDKIDEDIAVNTEEKYNRVSDEMFKFHKENLFLKIINQTTMKPM